MAIEKNLNEIIRDAKAFSKRWMDVASEKSEAQTFWNEFFTIFGLDRKELAHFEKSVKKINDKGGKIDLFWQGKLAAEHKSKGEDLNEAKKQLNEYWVGLKKNERPRYLIVSDFENIMVHDTDTQDSFHIKLRELAENIEKFSFIYSDYKSDWTEEEIVNIKATDLMAKLHDALKSNGYRGENLEKLLMRILFCLFADSSGIFPKNVFKTFIVEYTKEDGTDSGSQLNTLFEILNIPEQKRQKNIGGIFTKFPYVNGSLYKDTLPIAHFSKKQRALLLECCEFNWNEISPVIFGSMFQYVMDEIKREKLGGHYTSEKNILKAINGLFLDQLYNEFNRIKYDKHKLNDFHLKIALLKLLDPACGCGNFLIISYRELRILEIEILKRLQLLNGNQTSMRGLHSLIHLDSFYGIEYEDFSCKVAETAMWLMEHKMNQKMLDAFGENVPTLPLKKSATIIHGNALRLEWNSIIPHTELTYIVGNPPFISKQDRNAEQNKDMDLVFHKNKGRTLDYVCAWYVKAADYIQNTSIKVAFVSTNSITQGEQVSELWKYLERSNIKYNFAHRTFKWSNEAKGVAIVYVVIIGFSTTESNDKVKYIYHYETPKSLKPSKEKVKNINPYLIDFDNIVIANRTNPISDIPEIRFGNQPNDGGGFLFSNDAKNEFIRAEPSAKRFIKPLIGAREYLNGEKKWCLWLYHVNPSEYRHLKKVMQRIEIVKQHRLNSARLATRELAETPYLFGYISQPVTDYLLIPLTSSENRRYIPISFFTKNYIANNTCSVIPGATLFHFGILTSEMHMDWMRNVCGRMKSDYRYSNKLVYNNFPFPENIPKIKIRNVEHYAKIVLNSRARYADASLADLYDPDTMPNDLKKAHNELDSAVELCYSSKNFKDEIKRLQFLFNLFKEKSTAPCLF